jgi:Trypsin
MMLSKWKIAAAGLIGGCLLLVIQNVARSLTNAEEVAEDDIGARASVFIRNAGKGWCSGVAYGDNFILTAAHCVIDRNGKKVRVQDLTVFYGKNTAENEGSSRKVSKYTVHEHYAKQMYYQTHVQPDDDIWENVPLNWEDIAILKIDRTHPAGTVGAFLPGIDNDFSAVRDGMSLDSRLKETVWFYLYGYFTRSKSIFKLQKGLSGNDEKLQKVIPGRKQGPWAAEYVYSTRQLLIPQLSGPLHVKQVGMCRGDSGGGVFLIKSDGSNYGLSLDQGVPSGGIELNDGHPVLIGLLVHWFVNKENNDRCSSNEEAGAVRIDYYRDWILEKIKELR